MEFPVPPTDAIFPKQGVAKCCVQSRLPIAQWLRSWLIAVRTLNHPWSTRLGRAGVAFAFSGPVRAPTPRPKLFTPSHPSLLGEVFLFFLVKSGHPYNSKCEQYRLDNTRISTTLALKSYARLLNPLSLSNPELAVSSLTATCLCIKAYINSHVLLWESFHAFLRNATTIFLHGLAKCSISSTYSSCSYADPSHAALGVVITEIRI